MLLVVWYNFYIIIERDKNYDTRNKLFGSYQ